MTTHHFLRKSAAFSVAIVIASSRFATAATGTYTGLGGDGLWTDSSNWSATPFPGAVGATSNGDTASFDGTGTGSTTLSLGSSGITIDFLAFNSGAAAYTLGTSSSQTLYLRGTVTMASGVSNNETIAAGLKLGLTSSSGTYTFTNNSTTNTLNFGAIQSNFTSGTRTLNPAGAGQINFNGVIANGASKVAIGQTSAFTGTTTFNVNNTFTGGTTLAGGTMVVASASALGAGALTITGGTLSLNGANVLDLGGITNLTMSAGTVDFTLSSATSFSQISGTGALSLTGGTFSLQNSVTNYAASYQLLSGFTTSSVSGLAVSGYDTTDYTANVSSAGVLTFTPTDVTAVPEPSTYALVLFGIGTLIILQHSRRRSFAEGRKK